MAMKLLAALNAVDPSLTPDVSISLVALTQRAIVTRAGQTSVARPGDAFVRSSSTLLGEAKRISGTPVEDSQSDGTATSGGGEYISGWRWSPPVERTAIAHYIFYASGLARWSGRLINLYA